MRRTVSGARLVRRVDVDVWSVMSVLMDVDLAPPDVPHDARPEVYEHDAHAELEERGDCLVLIEHHVFQDEDDQAQDEQGGRVTGSP